MGQEIQLKLNNNNVSPKIEIIGDGQLTGFTATDLIGAANELKTDVGNLRDGLAYVENGNTATLKNYSKGEYICWKGTLYTANTTISSGVSFSTGSGGNLDGVSEGGLNALRNTIDDVQDFTDFLEAGTNCTITTSHLIVRNHIVRLYFSVKCTATIGHAKVLCTVKEAYRKYLAASTSARSYVPLMDDTNNGVPACGIVNGNGSIYAYPTATLPANTTLLCDTTYILK